MPIRHCSEQKKFVVSSQIHPHTPFFDPSPNQIKERICARIMTDIQYILNVNQCQNYKLS